jgi:hypothetical protein
VSVGHRGIVQAGSAGTLQASTSSSTIAAVPASSVLPGEVVVLVAYVTGVDCRDAKDAGDGWRIVSSAYDTGNSYGGFIAVLNAVRGGSSGYAGITLPGTGAYTAQTYSLGLGMSNVTQRVPYLRADQALGSEGVLTAGNGTAINMPPTVSPHYSQWVGVYGAGYDNGGTTTTVGALSTHNERFDTGQTSPPHGVCCGDIFYGSVNPQSDNFISNAYTSITLAVAKTKKVGLYAVIPYVANTTAGAAYKRMARGRRYG